MQGFRFRLEVLKQLREQSRDHAQLEMTTALKKRDALAGEVSQARDEITALEQHMRNAARQKIMDVDRLLDGHRHQLALQMRLAQLDEAMRAADDEVRRCREKLTEADRQVKVLEKLHDRQLAEHRLAMAQHEQKQNDETAVIRAARRT